MSVRQCLYVLAFYELVFSQQINEVCKLKSGQEGKCTHLIRCRSAVEDIKNKQLLPEICGYEFTQPIVCCPEKKVGDRAGRKCKEYAKAVKQCNADTPRLEAGRYKAKVKEYPHMAAVGFERDGKISWLCGGALISENYVLTTAHCIANRTNATAGKPTGVKFGMNHLNDTHTNTQIIKIAQLVPHPKYKGTTYYNDIVLIKLEKSVVINEFVRPACLNTKRYLPDTEVLVVGWEDENSNYEFFLSKEVMYTQDQKTYSAFYGSIENSRLPNGIMDDSQLLIGLEKIKINYCRNTQGSFLHVPSIHEEATCMYDIVGAESFDSYCVGKGRIYTRVSHYIEWIEDTVWG